MMKCCNSRRDTDTERLCDGYIVGQQNRPAPMASDLEELDLISAVWILASTDENHLITFEGLRERLGLEKSFDVKGLVLKRRELFRPGAPSGELEEWQSSMRSGSRLPTWIKLIPEGAGRVSAIDALSQKDVFRSQFRSRRGAPKSQLEIVSWGLEHIDRLRKSKIAARDASAKSWQMWLVFCIGVANIIATIWLANIKDNETTSPKAATALSQPIVTGVVSQAGVRRTLFKTLTTNLAL